LWWLLRWLGHEAVAVLDGGFAKWVAEGRPTSVAAEPRDDARVEFHAAPPRGDMTIGIDDVSAHARDGDWRLLDARAPERYRGEVEPMDPVAGHIPGAANHFYQRNIDERGRCARRKICARDLPTSMASRPSTSSATADRGSGVPQPARARARGYIRSEAVSGIVESVGERSFEAGRTGPAKGSYADPSLEPDGFLWDQTAFLRSQMMSVGKMACLGSVI
jgi:rhodanese-related sulfurtransferase